MQKLRDQDIDSRFSFSKGNVWSNKSFSLLYFKTKVMAKENALLRNGKEPFRFHSHKSNPAYGSIGLQKSLFGGDYWYSFAVYLASNSTWRGCFSEWQV